MDQIIQQIKEDDRYLLETQQILPSQLRIHCNRSQSLFNLPTGHFSYSEFTGSLTQGESLSLHIIVLLGIKLRNVRSSLLEAFYKKRVLRNFAKFTGKHLCQSFFIIKKETLAKVFSCEFCEISKNTFFTFSEGLLLFLSEKNGMVLFQ